MPISSVPDSEDGTYIDLTVYDNPPPELAKWDPYANYFATADSSRTQGATAGAPAPSYGLAGSPTSAQAGGSVTIGVGVAGQAPTTDVAVPVMSHSSSNGVLLEH